jgi:hypothetical protein
MLDPAGASKVSGQSHIKTFRLRFDFFRTAFCSAQVNGAPVILAVSSLLLIPLASLER